MHKLNIWCSKLGQNPAKIGHYTFLAALYINYLKHVIKHHTSLVWYVTHLTVKVYFFDVK